MRARLTLKLMSLVVLVGLTVVGAHSCSAGSSPSSPLEPSNIARNGLAGLCAEQAANALANGTDTPSSLDLSGASGGEAALRQALGGTLKCPTATTVPGG